jgi:2-polyprenyl-3-methyl-5-hydroxy-6-metoxy-1,4-benzoquinol methylase
VYSFGVKPLRLNSPKHLVGRSKRSQENSLRNYFSEIYTSNSFKGVQSKSGPGSDFDQTTMISMMLPKLIASLEIETFCDIPCGDFNWMKKVNLSQVEYFGYDIASELVSDLKAKYESDKRHFGELNIVEDEVSAFDLIFCRDLLVHLNYKDAQKAIDNICRSESKYLLTTTFPTRKNNINIRYKTKKIGWYPINLELEPFNFPAPIEIINENCTEANGEYRDKSLALYEIRTLK